MKSFEEFIKRGVVRRQTPQIPRARDLIEESKRKEKSLRECIEKVGLRDDNANDFIEDCYAILMSLIRAKLFIDGYSASGYNAHESEVSFMQKLGFNEADLEFMDKIRYFRNGISYYGTKIDKEYAKKVLVFTKKISSELRKIISDSLG